MFGLGLDYERRVLHREVFEKDPGRQAVAGRVFLVIEVQTRLIHSGLFYFFTETFLLHAWLVHSFSFKLSLTVLHYMQRVSTCLAKTAESVYNVIFLIVRIINIICYLPL